MIKFSSGNPVPYTCKLCAGEYTLLFVDKSSSSEKESGAFTNNNTIKQENKI